MLPASRRCRGVALLLALMALPAACTTATYRNPVVFGDYSDPDVVRMGDDFYMVSSSFTAVPALPVLHSRDLVTWTLIGHAAPRLPSPRYDTPQHGMGVWAPSLRHHDGKFWIYYGDPDVGIFMTRATDPRGPWEPLTLVAAAQGWIDPCPLWDDDGSMYLVHAWAKSRAGFNSVLTLRRLNADGRRLLGSEAVTVFDGTARHPTIEGPKFYKRNGYYYIFAPAGGVANGWQTVLRSRTIAGPYEDRIVLRRGGTNVNGPHQGGWIETARGESWFVHFQDRGAFGRIVHLQPMTWRDDWPIIGVDRDGDGIGEPVGEHARPAGVSRPLDAGVQTTDEFATRDLGLQWQWQANPSPDWWSLAARPGHLRLTAQPAPGTLWTAPALLLQKLPAERFVATASLDLDGLGPEASAGVVIFGLDYAVLRARRTGSESWIIEQIVCRGADQGGAETIAATAAGARRVDLRVTVAGGAALFSYSLDQQRFHDLGDRFELRPGKWVGAKVGLVALQPATTPGRGYADVDGFRVHINE
jgi:beta-xylosidase